MQLHGLQTLLGRVKLTSLGTQDLKDVGERSLWRRASSKGRMEPSWIREISWSTFQSVNHRVPEARLGIKNFSPPPPLVYFPFGRNPQRTPL